MLNRTRRTKLFPDNSIESKRNAMAWEKEEIERLKNLMTAMESLTLVKWTNEYFDEMKRRNYSIQTIKEKIRAFKALGAHEEVTPLLPVESIDRYLAKAVFDYQFKTKSGNAVNKDRKNLAAAWNWALKNIRDWPSGENPFLAVDRYPENRVPRYVPPESDFWTVYRFIESKATESDNPARQQDLVMLQSYLYLAGRRGELFRLRFNDLDFGLERVRLWTRKRKDGQWEYDWLPMLPMLKTTLRRWMKIRFSLPVEDRKHVFICLDVSPFCEQYYGLPFKQRRHAMNKWCERAGVKQFGFHAIRHLTASLLYKDGATVAEIQAILRHKSARTTEIYLNKLGFNRSRKALIRSFEMRNSGSAEVIEFSPQKADGF